MKNTKFEDKYSFILTKNEEKSLCEEYSHYNVTVNKKKCEEYSEVLFWIFIVFCACLFQLILKISIVYFPLYLVGGYFIVGLVEFYFYRISPQKKINEYLERQMIEEKEKEKEELKRQQAEEAKERIFTREKAFNLITEYKNKEYPEYIHDEINLFFKRLEALITVSENVERYSGFLTIHVQEVLNIVSTKKDSHKDIELSKNAVKALSDFVAKEIRQYRLGVSLDESSTLQAYINLYGNGKEFGGDNQ